MAATKPKNRRLTIAATCDTLQEEARELTAFGLPSSDEKAIELLKARGVLIDILIRLHRGASE
jgi:hypothetical protein